MKFARLFNDNRTLLWTLFKSNIHGYSYSQFGNPSKVLNFGEINTAYNAPGKVRVQWLAVPLNPADLNQIEGVYPIKPKSFPAIPGTEGVGIVVQKCDTPSKCCDKFELGDRVVPTKALMGTLCEENWYNASDLFKVPSKLPLGAAATMSINPPTAYRMVMENLVNLRKINDCEENRKQDDVVLIQNAANSSVGQIVIQLAKLHNIKTVNVVRQRPEFEFLRAQLLDLGADVVTTEENLKDDFANSGLSHPGLALNAVGGLSSLALAKLLRPNGTIVTYGGMSKQPVQIPTGLLIFKNIKAKGFWLSGDNLHSTENTKYGLEVACHMWLIDCIRWRWRYSNFEDLLDLLREKSENIHLHDKLVLLTKHGREYQMQEAKYNI